MPPAQQNNLNRPRIEWPAGSINSPAPSKSVLVSVRTPTGKFRALLPNGAIVEIEPDWVRGTSLTLEGLIYLRHSKFWAQSVAPATALPITVLPTIDCNLSCNYCFQNIKPTNLGTNPPVRRVGSNRETLLDISELSSFVNRRMETAGLSQVDLTLFGGEPLIAPNKCEEIVRALRPLGLRHTSLVTNGVPMTEGMAHRMSTWGVTHVQVTLDGGRDSHDASRHTRKGAETYTRILENLAGAARIVDATWLVRVNVTSGNVTQLTEVVDDLLSLKSVVGEKLNIDFSPVENFEVGFSDVVDASIFVDRVSAALHHVVESGFSVPGPIRSLCGFCEGTDPGNHGAVVDSDGKLYSCWDDVGHAGLEVGSLEGGYFRHPGDLHWGKCGTRSVDGFSKESLEIDRVRLALCRDEVNLKNSGSQR